MKDLLSTFSAVRAHSRILSSSTFRERNSALKAIADLLEKEKESIFHANMKDLEEAERNGTGKAVMARLKFDNKKLAAVTEGIAQLIALPDPKGRTLEKRELDKDFILEKRTYPIGVIGMVFEARPDALLQIASLALKSGNGLILKGGKECAVTNRTLVDLVKRATAPFSFSSGWICGIESRDEVSVLLKAEEYVDLLIPRGSNAFVRYCMDNTRIPVMGHADGICHTYVDKSADVGKALKVCLDAKIQYSAACNATETFLVHSAIAPVFLPLLSVLFKENGVIVHADRRAASYMECGVPLLDGDADREYLAAECNVIVVDSIEEASSHIAEHGSHHTDAIITEDRDASAYFIENTDSADVFVNCSTRFADGFRFGLGAEVGISTSKLHARGPVGLDGLMTTKWILLGNGETVAEYSDGRKCFRHKELM